MSLLRSACSSFVLAGIPQRLLRAETRSIRRWVAPTLRELRKRAEKLGPQAPQPRSSFKEWNHRAELFAFSKRLQEEFKLPLLHIAFTERSYVNKEQQRQIELGIENTDIEMDDNRKLAEQGVHLAKEYIMAYLQYSFPQVPNEGHKAIAAHLLSQETLAHIASHLGMTEIILTVEYPPSEETLAHSLLAVIGALAESSGVQRAFLFIRDFICTHLNQRDLLDIWQIENPEELLQKVCIERKWPNPESRLLGDCGKNTVLAAYHVGLYINKKLIGKGFGEDIPTAIKTASLDALLQTFGITENMRPLNFQVKVEPRTNQIEQN